jgi:hypothetical protein
MEKIHITIEDGINPGIALERVRTVVSRGRISKNCNVIILIPFASGFIFGS